MESRSSPSAHGCFSCQDLGFSGFDSGPDLVGEAVTSLKQRASHRDFASWGLSLHGQSSPRESPTAEKWREVHMDGCKDGASQRWDYDGSKRNNWRTYVFKRDPICLFLKMGSHVDQKWVLSEKNTLPQVCISSVLSTVQRARQVDNMQHKQRTKSSNKQHNVTSQVRRLDSASGRRAVPQRHGRCPGPNVICVYHTYYIMIYHTILCYSNFIIVPYIILYNVMLRR